MRAFFALVKCGLRLSFRRGLETLTIAIFFVISVILFPFGVGPDPTQLSEIGPGTIWVAALFSTVLSLERLFQNDFEDGSLELLVLQPVEMASVVLAKVTVHWLTTGIPLIIIAPLLAVLVNLPESGFWILILSLVIGTPSLSLIGTIGAALIIGAKRGGMLLSLIILPLYIPVLIFGVNSVNAAANSFPVEPHLMILTAIFLSSLALCPWVSAMAVRQAVTT